MEYVRSTHVGDAGQEGPFDAGFPPRPRGRGRGPAVKKQPEQSADELALGKVIARELRQQLRDAESDCPETETLAAFYDRTLTGRESALWEKHFLGCLRCQEYLAELARLADADEPPTLLADDAAKAAESPGWFYRLAWVIPFLIIGVASVIWYREEVERYLPQLQETANNLPPPAPPAEQPQPAGEVKGPADRAMPLKDLAKSSPPPISSRVGNKAKSEQRRDAPSPVVGREAESAAGVGGGIATPAERASLSDAAKMPEQALKMEVEEKKSQASDYVAPAAAAAPPAPKPAAAEADSMAARKESSQLGGLTIRGVQPKSTTKWRVGPKGTIQKADESGGWERVASGVQEDLFDISFAGDAGWAVGHEGAVLRSTDGGNTWRKVSAPTSEDLIHVSTQGGQQAQVIARSGKTYTTTDGGRTWK